MLSHISPAPRHDHVPSADPDQAITKLGRGLVASRLLMRRSRTLIALVQCPGPALHDPIDN